MSRRKVRGAVTVVVLWALCVDQVCGFHVCSSSAVARRLSCLWSPRQSFELRRDRPTPSISRLRASGSRAKLSGPATLGGLVKLEHAYLVAGVATTGSWVACALGALATYKPWRYTHNTIGVLQALTALPLIWACFHSLAVGSREGWLRLRQTDCRRLNLGLAAASFWMAITVAFSPAFTSALVRTVDPVVYPIPLQGQCQSDCVVVLMPSFTILNFGTFFQLVHFARIS